MVVVRAVAPDVTSVWFGHVHTESPGDLCFPLSLFFFGTLSKRDLFAARVAGDIPEVFVATFRVARLTLQARKLWLVGVAIDRDAPWT